MLSVLPLSISVGVGEDTGTGEGCTLAGEDLDPVVDVGVCFWTSGRAGAGVTTVETVGVGRYNVGKAVWVRQKFSQPAQ